MKITILVLIILLIIASSMACFFGGYIFASSCKERKFEIRNIFNQKDKPPDNRTEDSLKKYNKQLFDIENYDGEPQHFKRR